ncbi:putative phage tail protein [Pseudomonas sp. PGPR40]|uniref:putative phage tail protein n=1 Tax=Pseudomonas sp. PGPR40 TaxID=2913476 RepID=UPI001EDC909B|nr:putative phage tail protein [Pseudomonas sp. PGPR40]
MGLTETDYQQQLRQMLPPGPAFDPALQPDWAQIVAALAPELARIEGNGEALLLELNPATATALLPYWEGYLGLPDVCTMPGSQTLDERRQAVLDKLTATGAPQLSYYRKLGTQLDIAVEIQEFRPARVGLTSVGDFLYGAGWPWSWIAAVPIETYGTDAAATLDCRLQRDAPEYTDVVLGFGQEVVDGIVDTVDQLLNAVHYVIPAAVAGIEDV